MYKCSLSKDEFKFFKKNPHCIASLCSLDRISDVNQQTNFDYIYSKETPEEITSTGFTKEITLKDVKKSKLIYEKIEELIPSAIDSFGSLDNVLYQRNGQRPTTAVHLGQLKLFLSTMQFLSKYTKPKVETHVIYPGSAPGNNIDLLSKLFPNCYWWLYDPRDVFYPNLRSNPKIKKIIVDFFLDSHIKEIQETIPLSAKMLLISDIRVCADVTEESVARDMKLQEDWVRQLKPDHAMLKFRLPRHLGSNYEYLDGEIYLQMFAAGSTTETRLVVDGKNIKAVKYNLDLYEGLMYFFNRRARVMSYFSSSGARDDNLIHAFDGCHDCVAAFSLIEDYIDKFNKKINAKKLMEMIVDSFAKYKLETLNKNLRKSLIARNGRNK